MSKKITVPVQSQMSLAMQLQETEYYLQWYENRQKELKASLLEELKKQGVKGVKLEDGTWYLRAERTTLKVKNEASAVKWAMENNAMKIDTNKAWKILRREIKLPKFFTKNTTEYLTIKRPKESQHD